MFVPMMTIVVTHIEFLIYFAERFRSDMTFAGATGAKQPA
jgi:hypothetical protein